ncbi:MAG TPA: hypothetical protein VGL59_04245 [Polyangia bacterium]|jgi:hypothetical protein
MNLEARRVIDQVRSARTPSADDKERIRKALAIGVVAAVASVPATAAGATVAAGKAAGAVGLASGLKVAVSVAVMASLGVGTYWLTRSTPAPRPVVAVVASEPAPPVAAEPAPPPTVEPTPIVAEAAPAPASRTGRDPLMAELSLLHKAQQAWRQGNSARALALAQQHARQYPHSVLGMERDALRVFALCALGQQAQARPLASAILKRAPGSPLRTSVEESCGGR